MATHSTHQNNSRFALKCSKDNFDHIECTLMEEEASSKIISLYWSCRDKLMQYHVEIKGSKSNLREF